MQRNTLIVKWVRSKIYTHNLPDGEEGLELGCGIEVAVY